MSVQDPPAWPRARVVRQSSGSTHLALFAAPEALAEGFNLGHGVAPRI